LRKKEKNFNAAGLMDGSYVLLFLADIPVDKVSGVI
jgi:hypothetical protein